MTNRSGTLVVVFWALTVLVAQRAGAEPVFGLNLVGTRVESGDVRAVALGGGFHLVDDTLGVGQSNPALLATISRVTFSASQFFSRDTNKTANLQAVNGSVKFTNLTFAFPVLDRLSLAVGYRARYDADGDLVTPMRTDAGERYNEVFTRRGGLFSFPFSAAVDLGRIKLGGFFAFENGSFDNTWTVDFPSILTRDAFSRQKREMSATSYGGGLVLRPWRRLLLGVTYESEIDYEVDVIEKYTNNSADGKYRERMLLPERWSAAVQFWPLRKLGVYGSASVSDFTTFKGLAFPPDRLAREEIGAAGLEYLHAVGRYPARVGVIYERLPYTLPDGSRITTIMFSVGSGLKFGDGKGKIDVTLQAGRMGSLETNTFETQVVRVYVGIGGSELWKSKRVER